MSPFVPGRVSLHVQAWCQKAVIDGACQIPERAVTKTRGAGHAGDIAVLYGPKDKPFALALYDPNSPIVARVLSPRMGTVIDETLIAARVEQAVARRTRWFGDQLTNGYRCIHGPGDGLPGLVVDRYADTLVWKVYTAAWFPWLPVIAEALQRCTMATCGLLRLSRTLHGTDPNLREGALLWGKETDLASSFVENGLVFEVDPIHGQKTGFFLDQRENRARVEALSVGKDVLNVFCYTGGFSLYAGRGGAARVVSVDASAPAIEALERNIVANRDAFSPATRWMSRCGDAFVEMEASVKAGERFGVVVIDPPSFAKRAAERETALRAYRRLARLGALLVEPDGVLVFASCSSRVNADQLEEALQAGARDARRRVTVRSRHGHAFDHPVAHPDQQYLKCLIADLR